MKQDNWISQNKAVKTVVMGAQLPLVSFHVLLSRGLVRLVHRGRRR